MTHRRVVIRPDTAQRLFYLSCAWPCEHTPKGRAGCQRSASAGGSTYTLPQDHPGICWLGSSTTSEGARVLAETLRYEVADATG